MRLRRAAAPCVQGTGRSLGHLPGRLRPGAGPCEDSLAGTRLAAGTAQQPRHQMPRGGPRTAGTGRALCSRRACGRRPRSARRRRRRRGDEAEPGGKRAAICGPEPRGRGGARGRERMPRARRAAVPGRMRRPLWLRRAPPPPAGAPWGDRPVPSMPPCPCTCHRPCAFTLPSHRMPPAMPRPSLRGGWTWASLQLITTAKNPALTALPYGRLGAWCLKTAHPCQKRRSFGQKFGAVCKGQTYALNIPACEHGRIAHLFMGGGVQDAPR